MEKYYFVYSVDTVTASGAFVSFCMVLDHQELSEIIGANSVLGVSVAMYDAGGNICQERDITRLLGLKSA